jgi:hypothetical protein
VYWTYNVYHTQNVGRTQNVYRTHKCIGHKMSIEEESVSDMKCISDTTCVLDVKHVFNFSTTSVPNIFRYDTCQLSSTSKEMLVGNSRKIGVCPYLNTPISSATGTDSAFELFHAYTRVPTVNLSPNFLTPITQQNIKFS